MLLEDGRTGRFAPHDADAVAAMLVPGATLLLRGDGLATLRGTVVAVSEVGASAAEMHPTGGKPPKPPRKPA